MTEENSEFANKLQEALSSAMGKQPAQEVVEEPEEVVEGVQEVEEATEEVVDEVTEEEQSEEKEEAASNEEFKLIPKEWTKAEQEKFQEALDNPDLKEAAEAFISRYENLRKDYHKKAGERAEYAKKVSFWDDIFDERAKDALRQKGMTEQDYVRNLLNVEQSLIANPVQTMKRLMEVYKVDPKQFVDDADDGVIDYDKTIAEMKRELDELKSNKKQSETQSAATEEAYIAKQIKDFEFAIDDNGEPKYPLFREVREEMGILLSRGKAKTLEEAYEMSPTVKELALKNKTELQSREEIEEEKRRVAKAKKAAKGVSNKKVAKQAPIKMSLEDRLREKFREARV